jgi:molybdopterin-binding protein
LELKHVKGKSKITLTGGNVIVSSITTHSGEILNLKEGANVNAIMIASGVIEKIN